MEPLAGRIAHRRRAPPLTTIALALALTGCIGAGGRPAKPAPDTTAQGWTTDEIQRWYRGSQGSRLLPQRWLLGLEQPGGTGLFMDRTWFGRFNYLWDPGDAMPVGFARDVQPDTKLAKTGLRWFKGQGPQEAWIGLNCAACHTGEVSHDGVAYRIEGGATLADFQGFTGALFAALVETSTDPAKFDRFAARVLAASDREPSHDTPENRASLRTALAAHVVNQRAIEDANALTTTPVNRYGHGRLDAVGHILNKVALVAQAENQIFGEPDAPVSYPFIWNISQHDFLQWNGIVPNDRIMLVAGRSLDAGALIRNTSEVVGVFADVTVRPKAGLGGYPASVNVQNLIQMEIQLAKLKSRVWPAAFGAPAPEDVRLGDRLFKRHCAGCHAELDRDDLTTPIKAEMTPLGAPAGIGTDPWMACNAFSYEAQGGLLTGTRAQVIAGPVLPARAPTHDYLGTVAIGSLLYKKWDLLVATLKVAAGVPGQIEVEAPLLPGAPKPQKSRAERLAQCIAFAQQIIPADPPGASPEEKAETAALIKAQRLLAYKGRPLNGIWATGPFLHNGSVRTLHDLLLPPAQRQTKFWVGNRDFDIVNVGYADTQGPVGSWFRTTGDAGAPIHGNSNAGHDYGNAAFTAGERRALVAYMKTL